MGNTAKTDTSANEEESIHIQNPTVITNVQCVKRERRHHHRLVRTCHTSIYPNVFPFRYAYLNQPK